ncbi:hypothetical protein ACNKHO_27640 [Shigella flexneri]
MTGIVHIASGDLLIAYRREGSNEMGEAPTPCATCRASWCVPVGDVRNGANAIYSGASEIWIGQ